MQRQAKTFFTLHTVLFTPRTSHFTLALRTPHFISSQIIELFSPHVSSPHLIPSLLTCHLSKFFSTVFISSEHWSTFLISSKFVSTHLSCSARQKSLTVREKSLAQKNDWAQKLLNTEAWGTDAFTQKSHCKILLYYKACTKHFPVLLCTTILAQSTSQYFLLCLHKALPSTTLYYKACTQLFPVLLCIAKLAQSTFQYDFVLEDLHKALPSTTLYYKACTKYSPVLLCTTKLAQSTSQYYFVLQSLHKLLLCLYPPALPAFLFFLQVLSSQSPVSFSSPSSHLQMRSFLLLPLPPP